MPKERDATPAASGPERRPLGTEVRGEPAPRREGERGTESSPGVAVGPVVGRPVERPGARSLRRPVLPTGRKRIARWVKWALAAMLAIAAVAGLALALRPSPVPVDLAEVTRGPFQVTVDEDGRTRVADRYVISAPLAGTLLRLTLEPGDTVARGAVVARLVPAPAPLLDPRARSQAAARVNAAEAAIRQAETAVTRAEAALRFAEREAARQRTLLEAGATAPQQVEQAELIERTRREELASVRFSRQVAESELALARAALRRFDDPAGTGQELAIRAPIAGRVLRVERESEGVVQPGTPLIEIGDPAALEIVADVLTTDAVEIQPGAPVTIERWGGPGTLRGHVHHVEPSAFTEVSALGVEEQRVNVIIDMREPRERWQTLGDGFRVEVRIVVWQTDDVVQLPVGAVFRRGDGWATYVAEDGRARLRTLRVGRSNGSEVQVLEGIEPGETVIVYPGDNVRDGVRIEPR